MISVLLLMSWMLAGVVAALCCRPHGETRSGRMSTALLFGPLWLPVALELRGDDSEVH